MTREEIISMEPGRKLDALVAEKVMEYNGIFTVADRWFYNDSIKEVIPWYSTDISAAWQVVEELQGRHLYTDIRTCADFYEVWITNHVNGQETGTFAALKLPEAIAKAALLAVLEATP